MWPLYSKKCVDGFTVLQVVGTTVYKMVLLTLHEKDEVKILNCPLRKWRWILASAHCVRFWSVTLFLCL